MKRFLISGLTGFLMISAIAPLASAMQTNLTDLEADLNGDGHVSITELKLYNRDMRDL